MTVAPALAALRPAAIAVGAGSRTVERLRGGSGCSTGAGARGASAMAGALDGAGAANGGAASRSATASPKFRFGRRRSGQLFG